MDSTVKVDQTLNKNLLRRRYRQLYEVENYTLFFSFFLVESFSSGLNSQEVKEGGVQQHCTKPFPLYVAQN